ncbi:hypothetical protein BC834DRAFT_373456 [Gloeopeniophorella convolvens]|nr:hypothetical protein BC834DRAFT_373456 [Gloeopeniophorella convolvens]
MPSEAVSGARWLTRTSRFLSRLSLIEHPSRKPDAQNEGHQPSPPQLEIGNPQPKLQSPASQLPADILIVIFEIYRDEFFHAFRNHMHPEYPPSTGSWRPRILNGRPAHLEWITCSHVCRRWRHVMLEAPSLWRRIPADFGPTWLMESFSRSQRIPRLHLFGNLGTAYDPWLHKDASLPTGTPQVASVSLTALTEHALMTIFEHFGALSSDMELLELVMQPPVDRYPVRNPMPLRGLIDGSPNVRHVSLHNLLVTWMPLSHPARSLTSLSVVVNHDQFFTTSPLADIQHVVRFLENTPALEVLSLIFCTCILQETTNSLPKTVNLPYLRELVLEDRCGATVYFLQHVDYPATAKLQAQFGLSWLRHRTVGPLLRHVFRFFHEDPRASETSGQLSWLYTSPTHAQLSIKATLPKLPTDSSSHLPDADAALDICLEARWRPFSAFPALWDILPASFTRTLVLDIVPANIWHDIAAHCPQVTEIHYDGHGIVSKLGEVFASAPESGHGVPFPELELLRLFKLVLTDPQQILSLRAALGTRKRLGYPLGRLVLEQCDIGRAWDVMHEVVEVVEVVGGGPRAYEDQRILNVDFYSVAPLRL